MKEREIGAGRDEAPGEDDFKTTDPIRKPSEEDKERRPQHDHRSDQNIGCQIIETQRDRKKKQSVKLAGIPDDALPRSRAEQRKQDILVIWKPEEAFPNRNFRGAALGFHPHEHRRLAECKANIDGHHEQEDRDQKRNSPAPALEIGAWYLPAADADDDERQQKAGVAVV